MKHSLLIALGGLTAALLVINPVLVAEVISTNGPYYATPSWDQTLPASTRFIVLSNFGGQGVLDRETGLVWQRAPSADIVDWFTALDFCRTFAAGGRAGWRLPSFSELSSLIDTAQVNPQLPPGNPFVGVFFRSSAMFGPSDFYWSVTTDQLNPTNALVLFFGGPQAPGNPLIQFGSFARNLSHTVLTSSRAWCVRAGQGPDTQ